MVFIHGAGLGGWIWEDVIQQLDYRDSAFAIDLLGRGKSKKSIQALGLQDYVDDVIKQIHQKQLDNIILVAHSLGGVIGIEVAKKLGSKLKGFVAVSAAIPTVGKSFITSLPFMQSLIMGALIRILGTKPPESAIRKSLCFGLDAQSERNVIETYSPESTRVYLDKVTADVPSVPSLYIRTILDKDFPIAMQTDMARHLKHAKIIDIKSGHLPMLCQAGALADALNKFYTQVELV